jgi:hypothetical protein
MSINNPPLKSSPTVLADWVEMRTLADPDGFFRLHKLKRYWDTSRETEESDPSGQQREEEDTDQEGAGGGDDDKFLDSLCDELAERQQRLLESYPFEFDAGGAGLRFSIKRELSEGAMVYLFCLLLTHSKDDEILDGTWLPTITNTTRDLFQACSTLAAAGHVSGCAISFGWPRPDGTPFLQKLREVYTLFGEGRVVTALKPGAPPKVKDSEVDIIAWKPRADKSPGKFYLLGQVASGDNWEDKSLMASIDFFHRAWFDESPVSSATASMFIPQFVQQVGSGSRNDRMDLLTSKFGHIIDRMYLPFLASEGIKLADTQETELRIERRSDMPRIIEWVNQQTADLQAAGMVPL